MAPWRKFAKAGLLGLVGGAAAGGIGYANGRIGQADLAHQAALAATTDNFLSSGVSRGRAMSALAPPSDFLLGRGAYRKISKRHRKYKKKVKKNIRNPSNSSNYSHKAISSFVGGAASTAGKSAAVKYGPGIWESLVSGINKVMGRGAYRYRNRRPIRRRRRVVRKPVVTTSSKVKNFLMNVGKSTLLAGAAGAAGYGAGSLAKAYYPTQYNNARIDAETYALRGKGKFVASYNQASDKMRSGYTTYSNKFRNWRNPLPVAPPAPPVLYGTSYPATSSNVLGKRSRSVFNNNIYRTPGNRPVNRRLDFQASSSYKSPYHMD